MVIPGKKECEDENYPVDKLCVVGVETTCKNRWRQVLKEAPRVKKKHILTIQPGISSKQLQEMREAEVALVMPKSLRVTTRQSTISPSSRRRNSSDRSRPSSRENRCLNARAAASLHVAHPRPEHEARDGRPSSGALHGLPLQAARSNASRQARSLLSPAAQSGLCAWLFLAHA